MTLLGNEYFITTILLVLIFAMKAYRIADNKTDETAPDAVPEPPDEPITQKGDIWIFGNHRLVCGDNTK
jgi:hypothetical protein